MELLLLISPKPSQKHKGRGSLPFTNLRYHESHSQKLQVFSVIIDYI